MNTRQQLASGETCAQLQAHGVALLLDANLRVLHASSNASALLGCAIEAGMPLAQLLGASAVQQIEIASQGHCGPQWYFSSLPSFEGLASRWQAHLLALPATSQFLLELAPYQAHDLSDGLASLIMDMPAVSAPEFAGELVQRMQNITGFERVRLFRCQTNGTALVLADSAQTKTSSFSEQIATLCCNSIEFAPRWDGDLQQAEQAFPTLPCLAQMQLAGIAPPLRSLLQQEGTRAVLLIPLLHSQILCGVLLCSAAQPIPAANGWQQFARGVAVYLGSLQCPPIPEEQLLQENRLLVAEQLMSTIVNNIPAMVFVKRASDLRFESFNRAGEALLGYKASDLLGKNDYDFFPKEQADFFTSEDRKVLAGMQPIEIPEEVITTAQGEKKILHTRKIAVRDKNGQPTHLLGVSLDITERIAYEAQIENLAFFDPLTKLPNRRLMTDRLLQAMTMSKRTGKQGALMMIDLDNFKALNDSLGHEMGDLLLIEVAERLTSNLREGDTVARLGGDEFLIILRGLHEGEQAVLAVKQIAAKIQEHLRQQYLLKTQEGDEHIHHCSSSIGITLFRGTQLKADELIKRADTAMYQAKHAGRDTFRFFDPAMQAAVIARSLLEVDLRNAVDEHELQLYFQPQLEHSGKVIGAEALVRWLHPRRGLVSPAEFIPLAEESGLILAIGEWVLDHACQQLARWAQDEATAHLTLAVNVSARQFAQNNFVDEVKQLLARTGASAARLKLELTESLLLENTEEIIAKMRELNALGLAFSLDDFGTGFSSLSYLKRLPLFQLKIDQSFVRDVLTDPNDAAIAKTIVALAQSLGLGVIAEGVESAAQRDFLASVGCYTYQGYFFCKPLALGGFEEFVRERG